MNFSQIANIVIPEGEVFSISAEGQTLWTKSTPTPVGPLPPDNEIWYESTSKPENPTLNTTVISNTWDSTTGKGVIVCESSVQTLTVWSITIPRVKKIWFPNLFESLGNVLKSSDYLEELYFGSSFRGSGLQEGDGIGGLNNLKILKAYNNIYFEDNDSALVSTTANALWSVPTLVRGTTRTDLRNSACQIIGRRCICDTRLTGCTLYFGSNITSFKGDWNIGANGSGAYTMYWYPVVAPTLSQTAGNLRCGSGTIVHIPVGSLSSYQTTWASLSGLNKMTFVEDL